VVNGVALETAACEVLCDHVDIRATAFDQTCDVVDIDRLVQWMQSLKQGFRSHKPKMEMARLLTWKE
jgi:hypothetical protein